MEKKNRLPESSAASGTLTQELQLYEQAINLFFRISPDLFCIASKEGYFLYLNPAWEQTTGYPAGEMRHKPFCDFIHPDDVEPTARIFAGQFERKGEFNCTIRFRRKDDSYKWLEWRGNASEDGKTACAVARDITEHKRVEDELRINEERYRLLAENARDVIWTMKLDGTITYISPSVEEMRGLTVEEAMHQPLEQILTHDSQAVSIGYVQKLYAAFVSGLPLPTFRGELEYYRKDGSTLWTECLTYPILGSDGSSLTMLGVTRDITERKRAETKIRQLNELLEQRVRERTSQLEAINAQLRFHLGEIEQFTYITNHDLQEPLRTLTHFTRLIQDDYAGKLDADGNQYIAFIYNSARRMKELVKGLFDYSLLGKMSVEGVADCNTIVDAVLHDLKDQIIRSQAKINVGELPVINGYPTELRLLFQNLVSNAVKFRKKEILPEILISAEQFEAEWRFAIADNGIGIRKQDQEKVFIIFKRMVKRDEFEGTGVGLAHCKKIVELHGGRIWVESNDCGGSTFYFTIPRHKSSGE